MTKNESASEARDPGGIIPLRWAASSRNPGRNHPVIPGRLRRNPHPDRRRVKALRSYTIDEVTLEVDRNTVRHWIKAWLPVIDDKRPILMLGADII